MSARSDDVSRLGRQRICTLFAVYTFVENRRLSHVCSVQAALGQSGVCGLFSICGVPIFSFSESESKTSESRWTTKRKLANWRPLNSRSARRSPKVWWPSLNSTWSVIGTLLFRFILSTAAFGLLPCILPCAGISQIPFILLVFQRSRRDRSFGNASHARCCHCKGEERAAKR